MPARGNAANLAGRSFDDGLAEAHLAVASNDDFSIFFDGDDCRSVPTGKI